jgi:hypothetical protein
MSLGENMPNTQLRRAVLLMSSITFSAIIVGCDTKTSVVEPSVTKASGFYRAKCYDEEKWFGNWNSDRKIAENYVIHHGKDYPRHKVFIESK